MTENDSNAGSSKADKAKSLISGATRVTGAAIGGGAGSLLGPQGTVAGAAVGAAIASTVEQTLYNVGSEIHDRVLAPREKYRAGTALAHATEAIKARLSRGDNVRTDGFFDKIENRSAADELLESAIQKCTRESQEKKIKHLAYFYSNIIFENEVSAEYAHWILNTAESLTYRQLCILAIGARLQDYHMQEGDYRSKGSIPPHIIPLLFETFELYSKQLIHFGGNAALSLGDVNPSAIQVQGAGVIMFNNMGLATIPDRDIRKITKMFRQ